MSTNRLLPLDRTFVPLAAHRSAYPLPIGSRVDPPTIIDAVRRSGLTGRGGASFPLARKLDVVASSRRRPVVVVNGCESEPASEKDCALLCAVPHLVLDGASIAATAIGADRIVVALERGQSASLTSLARANAERAREASIVVEVVELPARFVSGEESAVVHFLNGGDARPTASPPRVFDQGVGGRPTLVSNVETIAHLATIHRHGPAWFREVGTSDEPGTMLVSLSGGVAAPGVYEVPLGARITDVLRSAGGASEYPQALLIGGFYGTWVSERDARDALLCNTSLRPLDARVGCGAIIVLPERGCGVETTSQILTWLSGETAKQCGPCVHGLASIAGVMDGMARGRVSPDAIPMLERWAGQVDGRGGCRLPDGATRLLRSALRVFAIDIARHSAGMPCSDTGPSVLRLPERITGQGWR